MTLRFKMALAARPRVRSDTCNVVFFLVSLSGVIFWCHSMVSLSDVTLWCPLLTTRAPVGANKFQDILKLWLCLRFVQPLVGTHQSM